MDPMTSPPPPLPSETHVCEDCGFDYASVAVDEACEEILALPSRVRDAALAVPARLRRLRPSPETWSVVGYACHLRDVYAVSTIRLHRARTEDQPALEPMLNDLRALRFRYDERDLAAVLDELAATATGFCEEVEAVPGDQWDRRVTRLPGESRTARWLVRHALHEGRHHLRDITAVARAVSGGEDVGSHTPRGAASQRGRAP